MTATGVVPGTTIDARSTHVPFNTLGTFPCPSLLSVAQAAAPSSHEVDHSQSQPVQTTPLNLPLKRLNRSSMSLERMRLTWPPSRFLLSCCHTTLCPIHFVIVGPRYHQPDAPITTVFCHHLSHSKAFFRDPCNQSGRTGRDYLHMFGLDCL